METRLATRTNKISPFYVMELLHRAKQLEAQGRDIIHMEIGEPDFATPENIMNAGAKQILTGEIKYTPAAGLPQLREKIAGKNCGILFATLWRKSTCGANFYHPWRIGRVFVGFWHNLES